MQAAFTPTPKLLASPIHCCQPDGLAAKDGKLTAKEVHQLLFTKDERAEYGFDIFEEDLLATQKDELGESVDLEMTWEQVEKFLSDNL